MEKNFLPKKPTGCGCGKNKVIDEKKIALDSKREQLIQKILLRRQKENPIYKTRSKLFL